MVQLEFSKICISKWMLSKLLISSRWVNLLKYIVYNVDIFKDFWPEVAFRWDIPSHEEKSPSPKNPHPRKILGIKILKKLRSPGYKSRRFRKSPDFKNLQSAALKNPQSPGWIPDIKKFLGIKIRIPWVENNKDALRFEELLLVLIIGRFF